MPALKKTLTAAAAALTMAGTLAISTHSAEARWGRNGAFFGGVIGGLALGIFAANAYHAPGYYYGPSCHWRSRRVYDPYYGWSWRRVRVCY